MYVHDSAEHHQFKTQNKLETSIEILIKNLIRIFNMHARHFEFVISLNKKKNLRKKRKAYVNLYEINLYSFIITFERDSEIQEL